MKKEDKISLIIAIGVGIIGVAVTLMVLATAPGCMMMGSVCEHIPDGQASVICKATDAMHVSPENLSRMLVITNLAALEANQYTAQEAMTFIETAENKLIAAKGSGSLTYGDVVYYLMTAYGGLSPAAQAVFIVVDPLSSLTSIDAYLPELLSDFDIDLLLAHLARQKAVVRVYL